MKLTFPLLSALMTAVVSCSQLVSAATIDFQEGAFPDASYDMDANRMRSRHTVDNMDDVSTDGGTTALFAGRIADEDNGRSVLAYDISAIPSGATIDSVTLTLTKRNDDNTGKSEDHTITLHELDGAFVGDGPTSPSWVNRDNDAPTPWDTPGGDFDATVLSSVVANSFLTDDGDKFVFPSSSEFVTAVQNAFNGSGTISMLLMSADSEADDDRGLFQFWSDNQTDVDDRPLLSIDYTPVPEPASLALILFGALGLAALRRRIPLV